MTAGNHLKRFPVEALNGNRFCFWCDDNRDKRPKKPPINVVTGDFAHTNNPNDWHPIETVFDRVVVVQIYPKFLGMLDKLKVNGIGRLLTYDQDGIFAIDLDNVVVNGELTELAREHLLYARSYAEYSPSGNGLRIFLSANFRKSFLWGVSQRSSRRKL